MDLCERSGRNRIEEVAYFYLVQALLARGDTAGAESEVEKIEWAASMPGTFPLNRAWHASFRVLYSIRRGDLKAAQEWGNRMSGFLDVLPLSFHRIWGRLLIAEGDQRSAMAFLQGLYARAAQAEAYGTMIGILVYQALAAGSNEQALTFLSEALELGEPRGYIRAFVDEGGLLRTLLEKALGRGITPNYTRKLLDIIEAEEQQRLDRQGEAGAPAAVPAVLSAREMEVLRLVAAGLSNRRIAERLVVTPGTIKVHVYNIMEKLGAQSRTQAVARASELKLI
jgi:LuxR family transcriptional regulator, maltose regulon positive regulatory protein